MKKGQKTLKLNLEDYPRYWQWVKTLSIPERKTIQRHQARTDLYFLLRYVCGRKDLETPWLFDRCREVQAEPDDRLDLWARDHRKSSIITFGLTIMDILGSHGLDPLPKFNGIEQTVGIFSHTRPIAKGFLRQIKREFEDNEAMKELFPDILWKKPAASAPKWSEDDGIIVKRKSNPKESTIEAYGLVDGMPIGKHYRVMVFDDIVTESSVGTPEMIDKTTKAVENADNLGTQDAKSRYIGTRYHFRDTYGEMIRRGVVVPRIYPATENGEVDGDPVLLTRDEIKKKYRKQGVYTFSCQMLLKPVADKTQSFKEEWLVYYDTFERDGTNIYILVDPANTKKKKSDYTAMFAVALCKDRKYRVVDMVRDKLGLVERGDILFNWHRKYNPMDVLYEKYGMQADIDYLEDRMERENYQFNIAEVAGPVAKTDRIKRLMPPFQGHLIIFPRQLYYTNWEGDTRDLIRDFIEEEYKAFPVPIHDDMLDCLARTQEPDYRFIWPKPHARMQSGPIRSNASGGGGIRSNNRR